MSTAVEVETSNPFPGLRPFREQEEHLFFGRENQVDAMVDKLAAARFLAVVGTSGSGKSSLVNCGLRPALHRGLMSAAGTAWRMVQFRPGGTPLTAMTSALAEDGTLYSGYRGDIPLSEVIDTPLRLSKRGLIDVFRRARLPNGVNLLVVVDQFEELFRYRAVGDSGSSSGERSQEAAAFVNLLLEAKQQADSPIYVVLTMRSDFLGSCAEFPGLPEAVNEGQYLVPRMTRDERRAAIRGPVGVGGAEITPVLLTRLVNDVGDNPDQLSILQHALNRTWSRWRNEGRGQGPLDLPHYEAIGTMAHALDQHAEKAYGELKSDRAKKCCEKIFKALTDKGTDPRGIRRPTDFKTLCALASASSAEVVEVIDVFRKPSRSFLMPPLPEVPGQDTVIDISHESLMRVWERLKAWADEEAQSAQLYRRLSETAALYAAGKAGLWRDPDLQVAIDWRNKEEPTAVWAGLYRGGFAQAMDFLAESEALRDKESREKEERQHRELEQARALAEAQRHRAEEEARAARRSRLWLLAVCVGLAVAVLATMFALRARREADGAKRVAEANEAKAVKAQCDAEEAQFYAEKAKNEADVAAGKLKTALVDADQQRKLAEHEARRNLSHELAGESVSLLTSDPGLSLLVALEAVSTTYRADKAVEKEAEESLQQAVQASQNRLLSSGHTKPVRAVAYSPTEPRLATASDDGTVKVWDATTGLRLLTLSGHDGPVNAVAFSLPDGKYLATAGDDKTVKLWEARSGKQLQTLGAHAGPVNAVAFSPNGTRLATASKDGSARVWDFRAGALGGNPLTFSGHTDEVRGIAFSPDGKYLATASLDGTTKVWDTAAPKKPASTFSANPNPSKDKDAVYAVAFSPDGQHLATAGQDGIIRVWDATDPSKPLLETPSNPTTAVRAVAFSKDGKQLATAGDKTARVWDVSASDGKIITLGKERRLSGHTESVWGVAFNSNGKQVAMASADTTSRVWDASYGQELLELSDVSVKETVLALSTDGKLVAASGSDGSIRLFDGVSGLELFTLLPSTTTRSLKMAFGPGGQYLAAIISGEKAHVWRMSDGQEVFTLPISVVPEALAVSKGGNRLATMTGKDLKVWDTGSIKSSDLPTNYTGRSPVVAFSPDDKYLAATSADRKVTIWDTSLGRSQKELSHPDIVDALSFSPDSKRLVTASRDNTVRFWDVQSGDEVRPLQIQVNHVYQIAFSPNGLTLATLSRDGNLKVWKVGKVEAEEELGLVVGGLKAGQPGTGYPGLLGFHPDGDLITATRDMVISEYPLTIEELMVFARRRVSRPWTDEQCHHYLHGEPCPSEILQVDPREETKELEAEALLASGRNLASASDWEGAQANFQRALALNLRDGEGHPELHFNPGLAAQHLAAPALAAKGRNLARSEDRDGAVASFLQAKKLDSSLSLDPEKEADKWMAKSLVAKGITLADSGNIDEATKIFQEARRRAPERDKDRITKEEATALRKVGTSLVNSGNSDGAKKAFQEAETLDPKSGKNLDPEKEANRLVTEANRLMAETLLADAPRLVKEEDTFKQGQDDYLKAVSVYKNVEELDRDGKIRAKALNDLCWNGSLLGHAAEAKVMDACEQAVRLDPKNADNYDSRGLARALTNNYSGAISDFQFFINNAPSNREKYRQDRKDWVEALRKGQNPFTPEVLKKMLAG